MLDAALQKQTIAGRALTPTSTPFQRSHLVAEVVGKRGDVVGLTEPGRIEVVQPGDRVAAAARQPWIGGAVMLNVSKSDAVTARLSMTVKLPYHAPEVRDVDRHTRQRFRAARRR